MSKLTEPAGRAPAAADTGPYLAAFEAIEKEPPAGAAAPWILSLREEAMDRFARLGFPSTRQEDWKYTNAAPIAKVPFRLAAAGGPGPAGIPRASLAALAFDPWPGPLLVFADGRTAPGPGAAEGLPAGVTVTSLAEEASSRRALVEPHLARIAADPVRPFAALNTAFLHDGAFIHVPAGTVVESPIHLLFVSAGGGATASCPRVLVVAEENSQVRIVESHAGLDPAPYFANAVTEVAAGDAAVVEHVKILREGEGTFHVAAIGARLGRGAAFTSHNLALSGLFARTDLDVVLAGEGASCDLNGLYLTGGRRHVDNHTVIDHAAPRGTSRELYKGVLGGSSRGVFDGKIVVRPGAQKTDARQVNRNLLLSEEALADAKPQLEINADDVKCAHAATTGQLDAGALFYLRTRGLSLLEARGLLLRAFIAEVVERIRFEPVRSAVAALALERLAREAGGEARP
jgi:Fe-S cluster assembly protein SufD